MIRACSFETAMAFAIRECSEKDSLLRFQAVATKGIGRVARPMTFRATTANIAYPSFSTAMRP